MTTVKQAVKTAHIDSRVKSDLKTRLKKAVHGTEQMLCSFTRWTVIPKKKKTTLACIFATITETVMNLSCHVGLDDASPCSPVIS